MGLAEQLSVREAATRTPLVAPQLVRIQYKNMPTAFLSNAVVSVILCFTLRDSVPTATLYGWLGAEYAWVVYRFFQWNAVRDGMQQQMRRWRCEVISAGSGEEIMEKAASLQHPPDLIVSDYRLRGEENGISLVARLREEFNSEIPALIVTGDTGPERLREAQASGLHILHKPLNPARLRALIASLRLAKSA
jgi:CheY-like chemotaxis protein